jgi:hypothetical protein
MEVKVILDTCACSGFRTGSEYSLNMDLRIRLACDGGITACFPDIARRRRGSVYHARK